MKQLGKVYVAFLLKIYFSFLGMFALGSLFDSILYPKFIKEKETLYKNEFTVFGYEIPVHITNSNIVAFSISGAMCLYYFVTNWWVMNNIIGISFTLGGIKLLKYTNFKIGLVILWGLFIYDIWWVFYTDVMVSVAKSVDGPILLKFPISVSKNKFSMLGLGDMIIPGAFVSLCLKFDIDRAINVLKVKRVSDIPLPFFYWNLIFYIAGIVITYIVMISFKHAQPALLYLVPCATIALILPMLMQGVMSDMVEYMAV